MSDTETTRKIQALVAQEIFIKNELQKRSEELKTSLLNSEILHKNDLLTFAIQKASKAEEQLEVSHEQIETLKGELCDTSQELKSYHQELESCHNTIADLEKEVWELTFNEQ